MDVSFILDNISNPKYAAVATPIPTTAAPAANNAVAPPFCFLRVLVLRSRLLLTFLLFFFVRLDLPILYLLV